MDDVTRYAKIKGQIEWKKSHSRRDSLLRAAEIFRVLKTKKHEYDCFGTSLVNLQYGVDVVNMMKYLNKSYVEDPTTVFKEKLRIELASATALRDTYIAALNERKKFLEDIPLDELRESFLKDLDEGKALITRRYKMFHTYLTFVREQHRNIAGIVNIVDELKVINKRISDTMTAVEEKIRTIKEIVDSQLIEIISKDIDNSIKVLNCQADNLRANILQSIEETNTLLGNFARPEDLPKEESGNGLDADEDDGGDEKDSKGGNHDGLNDKEFAEEESSDVTHEGDDDDYDGDGKDSDFGYMMAAVGKPLIQGLTHKARQGKPTDPICFVSKYMRHYRESETNAQSKYEDLKMLLAETARIQLVNKTRGEEEEQETRQKEEAMLFTQ